MTYDAYVDGAYAGGRCAWAVIILDGGAVVARFASRMTDMHETLANQRNVASEMKAAMMAAAWARTNDVQVHIYHDYEGVSKWPTGEWGAGNEWTQKYRDYMRDHEAVDGYTHVKAHSGDKWNERADRMAHSAAVA